MPTMKKDNILITGSSSGIGKASVLHLIKFYNVYAGVRNEKDFNYFKNIGSDNLFPVYLDITKPENIENVCKLLNNNGGIKILVNNAAAAYGGPIEIADQKEIENLFKVNVFAQIELTQYLLPQIRARSGRVIFVNSTNGFITYPFMGVYCSTKHALEAFADALRLELRPWKVKVISINPDKIESAIWTKAIDQTLYNYSYSKNENKKLYFDKLISFIEAIKDVERQALSPSIVAELIHKACYKRRPRHRYLPGFEAKLIFVLTKLFPKRIIEKLILSQMKL